MRKKLKWILPVLAVTLLVGAFFFYTAIYYHADETAFSSLLSDEKVTVVKTGDIVFFDGPSADKALVFYPGAKVEEESYAPMLRKLAEEGMDVFLVKMAFHLAFFGSNKAGAVMEKYAYDEWYVGGHSLGGAMAANYAADHPDQLTGLILFAAYPTKPLDPKLQKISIYGSEDKIVKMEKIREGHDLAPSNYYEYVIEGGNHSGFGNYGAQRGDGAATISNEEQQAAAVTMILEFTSGTSSQSRRRPPE